MSDKFDAEGQKALTAEVEANDSLLIDNDDPIRRLWAEEMELTYRDLPVSERIKEHRQNLLDYAQVVEGLAKNTQSFNAPIPTRNKRMETLQKDIGRINHMVGIAESLPCITSSNDPYLIDSTFILNNHIVRDVLIKRYLGPKTILQILTPKEENGVRTTIPYNLLKFKDHLFEIATRYKETYEASKKSKAEYFKRYNIKVDRIYGKGEYDTSTKGQCEVIVALDGITGLDKQYFFLYTPEHLIERAKSKLDIDDPEIRDLLLRQLKRFTLSDIYGGDDFPLIQLSEFKLNMIVREMSYVVEYIKHREGGVCAPFMVWEPVSVPLVHQSRVNFHEIQGELLDDEYNSYTSDSMKRAIKENKGMIKDVNAVLNGIAVPSEELKEKYERLTHQILPLKIRKEGHYSIISSYLKRLGDSIERYGKSGRPQDMQLSSLEDLCRITSGILLVEEEDDPRKFETRVEEKAIGLYKQIRSLSQVGKSVNDLIV